MKIIIGFFIINYGIKYPHVALSPESGRYPSLLVDHHGQIVSSLFVLVERDAVAEVDEV